MKHTHYCLGCSAERLCASPAVCSNVGKVFQLCSDCENPEMIHITFASVVLVIAIVGTFIFWMAMP